MRNWRFRNQTGNRSRQVWLAITLLMALLAALLAQSRIREEPADLSRDAFPGFTVEETHAPLHALVVTSVQSEGEATQSGIVVGDNLLAINGHSIDNVRQAARAVKSDTHDSVDFEFSHRNVRYHARLSHPEGNARGA